MTVCVIRLASGKGRCALAARRLHRGTYRLIARYLGAPDFARSTAAARLKVVRLNSAHALIHARSGSA